MTEVVAKQIYIRVSPRKSRLVAKAVKGWPVDKAQRELKFMTTGTAQPVLKVLNQAVANAKNNLKLNEANLVIKAVEIDEGPKYKRWQPVSRGRAHAIHKPTSHIKVVLETKEERGTKS